MKSEWFEMRKKEVATRFGSDYLIELAESGDETAKKVLGIPQDFDCEWCLTRYRVCSLEKDEYDNECIFIKRRP